MVANNNGRDPEAGTKAAVFHKNPPLVAEIIARTFDISIDRYKRGGDVAARTDATWSNVNQSERTGSSLQDIKSARRYPTTDELLGTLLLLGDIQALWDSISPKSLARLAELGMLRDAENKPPQLTTLGEIFCARVEAGQSTPDLEHLT